MKYQLAIFDMDGTILNTIADLADRVNYALSCSNYPTRTLDEDRNYVGNGIRKLIERAVPAGTSPEELEQVYADFTAYYPKHCYDKTKPYSGIIETIQNLRKQGIKTAVVSNKADYAVQILDEKYFPGLLDMGEGEREGIARKPHADMVYAVLEQ